MCESKSEDERREILPEFVAKEIAPPFPPLPDNEDENAVVRELVSKMLPELVAKDSAPPLPELPVYARDSKINRVLVREISPELVTKDIAPALPALLESENENERELEPKPESVREIFPELLEREIDPPLLALSVNENESKLDLVREILPELLEREIDPPLPVPPAPESRRVLLKPLEPMIAISPRPYTRISPPLVPGTFRLASTFPRIDILPGKVLGMNWLVNSTNPAG
ncbi:hypothetical protein DSM106972_048290 [Dulcicalothrix desertica PCC 7102]|uniref:Uncharacterized protein n=1 Tax=Dulcicalothrix desertica PCC 7102 TaxID=232991 RepID=A0A433VCT6_9CYAN|nr:hypothetical protein DSM106972_048290 [Dulcicalothrix desertica PCC 7102]